MPGYTLGAALGRGASSSVWAATRDRDGRRFAVKIVPGGGPLAAAAEAQRESGVLGGFAHAHVVRLEDVVPTPDGALALVLQLAEGGSLAQVVTSRGHLSAGETVTVLAPLAGALSDLHAAGVVHSDLSPANVLFTGDGMPLLSDLGVARLIGELPDHSHGTDGFVAPEASRGAVPGPAADVYALGCLGWYALTGSVPPSAVVRPVLAGVARQAPAELVALIDACMSSEPAGRPAAHGLALRLYDTAAPVAVQLASGADPAAALTHRLRAEAGRPVSVEQAKGGDGCLGARGGCCVPRWRQ